MASLASSLQTRCLETNSVMTREPRIPMVEALEPRRLFSANALAEGILGESLITDGDSNNVVTLTAGSSPQRAETSPSAHAAGETNGQLLGKSADYDTMKSDLCELTSASYDYERYMLCDRWGGDVVDAEKSRAVSDGL